MPASASTQRIHGGEPRKLTHTQRHSWIGAQPFRTVGASAGVGHQRDGIHAINVRHQWPASAATTRRTPSDVPDSRTRRELERQARPELERRIRRSSPKAEVRRYGCTAGSHVLVEHLRNWTIAAGQPQHCDPRQPFARSLTATPTAAPIAPLDYCARHNARRNVRRGACRGACRRTAPRFSCTPAWPTASRGQVPGAARRYQHLKNTCQDHAGTPHKPANAVTDT